MAEIHENQLDLKKMETILEEDIHFTGEGYFGKETLIRGSFSGSIEALGTLYLDEKSVIKADIRARSVHVRGRLKGNIHASHSVTLEGTADMEGDITASQINIIPGSQFNGNSKMIKPGSRNPEDKKPERESDRNRAEENSAFRKPESLLKGDS